MIKQDNLNEEESQHYKKVSIRATYTNSSSFKHSNNFTMQTPPQYKQPHSSKTRTIPFFTPLVVVRRLATSNFNSMARIFFQVVSDRITY